MPRSQTKIAPARRLLTVFTAADREIATIWSCPKLAHPFAAAYGDSKEVAEHAAAKMAGWTGVSRCRSLGLIGESFKIKVPKFLARRLVFDTTLQLS